MSERTDASPETNPDTAVAADDPPAPPAEGTEATELRALARWVAVEVFLYVIVALGLIFLALRRGRLSDALLVMLTVLITTPMILGYRQQAIERLRGGRRSKAATEEPAPSDAAAAETPAGDGTTRPPSAG